MFTAKITSVSKSRGGISILVEYTNGVETFNETLVASGSANLAWLNSQARIRVKEIQRMYDFADTLAPEQVIDTADVVPPVLTQAEIDQNTFLQDYHRWLAVKQAIDVGILTGLEAPVVALLNKVKAGFKPAYLTIL